MAKKSAATKKAAPATTATKATKAAAKPVTKAKAAPKAEAPAEAKTVAAKAAPKAVTKPAVKKAAKAPAAPKAAAKVTKPAAEAPVAAAKPPATKAAKATSKATAPAPAAAKARSTGSTTRKASAKKSDSAESKVTPAAPTTVLPRGTDAAATPTSATTESGTLRPAAKRPAVAPPVTGAAIYRREREEMRRSVTVAPTPAREISPNLPTNYGVTRITTLVRDPEWMYAFWEISDATRAELGIRRGNAANAFFLRVYDVTDVAFDGTNARSYVDVPVNDYSTSWYVRVPQMGRAYQIDLGMFTEDGHFLTLARSNSVAIPAATIAREADPVWNEPNHEVYNQILRLSGGTEITSRLGSEEFVHALQRKLLEEASMFSGLFSGSLMGPSSEFMSSESAAGVHRVGERGRNFWLEVGVDVIVYGATEPDAAVKLMGRPIQLSPDGTFRIRMALPDGQIDFPVEATSADEVETRKVCPVVRRNTYGDPTKPV